MFKFTLAVFRKSETLAILNHFLQRVQQSLWCVFRSFFLHSLVHRRDIIWDLAQISATYNAKVVKIFSLVLFISQYTYAVSDHLAWGFGFSDFKSHEANASKYWIALAHFHDASKMLLATFSSFMISNETISASFLSS